MNNQYMIDNLTRQKDRIDEMIRNYQQPQPINNFINTNMNNTDMYEMKKLNENDEVENIAIFKDTIFIGDDRLQIKKVDGTIEKYEIKKIYPRDKKDEKIDELNKKIEELERRLMNNEFTNVDESVKGGNQSNGTNDGDIKSKSKATSESDTRNK